MTTRLITAPTLEPITLAEAKLQLRVDTNDEDALIQGLITAAREQAETITKRSIMPQTWEKTLDEFPDADIELLNPNVISIDSVKYINQSFTQVTLSNLSYTFDNDSEPAWLILANNYTWPVTAEVANAVRVRYTAGYANAASVPQSIKTWILLAIETLYDRCKSGDSASIDDSFAKHLLDRYIVWG